MNTKELRIGNLVNYAEEGTIFTVMLIDHNGIGVQNQNESTWIEIDQFEGIPLTEEWLLKFGFEKQGMSYVKEVKNQTFEISKWSDGRFFYGCYLNLRNRYIHQLQNLYFALTSEELIIKADQL
jgi:hypothetical protein